MLPYAIKPRGLTWGFILLFVLFCQLATAQLYPVQANPNLVPPYSLKLSDYATTTSEKLLLNLLMTDVNEANLQVRLRMSIEGDRVSVRSTDFVQGATPIRLIGGVPTRLSNLDLRPYFDLRNLQGITPRQYNTPLPDGLYQFCFEVFDFVTGRQLSQKRCIPVYLVLNDPPFLNLPQRGEQIGASNPQNLIFQWTPRHLNATGVKYEFQLRELWDGGIDPQAAFLASPDLYSTTTFATTLHYGPGETTLLEGKTYGWRVRALVGDGISETSVFRNNGFSEIFNFTYTGKCDVPKFILAKSEGTSSETISWQTDPNHIGYQVQYRKPGKSGAIWFEAETTGTTKTLIFLEPATTYEFRVGGQCLPDGGYSFSAVNTFTTPSREEASQYNCGIPPEILITNQDPLESLNSGDKFTAGDFPVKVVEASGGNGTFSGRGVIEVPYLSLIKIAVGFDNISINTDGQMTDGTVETAYDADFETGTNAGSMSIAGAVDKVKETVQKAEDIIADIFNNDDENEENAPSFEYSSLGNSTSDNPLAQTENDATAANGYPQDNSSNETDNVSNDTVATTQNNESTGSPGASSTPANEPGAPTESAVAVIAYNGTEYGNNDIIEVEYDKDNPHFAFLLKNYPEGSQFNWQVLYQGTDYTARYAQSETIHDNLGIDMKNLNILDVVANYGDSSIKVTVKRKMKEFKLEELYAAPVDSPDRLARSGKPLYLVKSSYNRKVDFGLDIEPKLNHGDISIKDITWYYKKENTQTNLGANYGRKNLSLSLTSQDEKFPVRVAAGSPSTIDKTVDVIWFDGTERAFSFMPPVISEVLTKNFKHIEEGVKLTEKFIPIGGLDFEVEPITINGSKANKEDDSSRLYYLEETESIGGGLTATLAKVQFTHPALKVLSRINVADVGLYAAFTFKFGVDGGVTRKKYIEQNKFENDEAYLKVTASGCLSVGAEAKLLVAENLIDLKVDFKAEACISGSGNYNFSSKLLTAEFYIPPAVLSGNIEIKTKGALQFELIDWTESITVGETTPLGDPLNYQF